MAWSVKPPMKAVVQLTLPPRAGQRKTGLPKVDLKYFGKMLTFVQWKGQGWHLVSVWHTRFGNTSDKEALLLTLSAKGEREAPAPHTVTYQG